MNIYEIIVKCKNKYQINATIQTFKEIATEHTTRSIKVSNCDPNCDPTRSSIYIYANFHPENTEIVLSKILNGRILISFENFMEDPQKFSVRSVFTIRDLPIGQPARVINLSSSLFDYCVVKTSPYSILVHPSKVQPYSLHINLFENIQTIIIPQTELNNISDENILKIFKNHKKSC